MWEQVFFPHAEVVGDVGPSLARLAERVEGKLPNAAALVPLRAGILKRTLDRSEESRFPLTPQRIVHDVRKVMPADGMVALDNGMYKIWFARCYRTRSANALLLDNALATMGAGLPSAMMSALLHPERRVLAGHRQRIPGAPGTAGTRPRALHQASGGLLICRRSSAGASLSAARESSRPGHATMSAATAHRCSPCGEKVGYLGHGRCRSRPSGESTSTDRLSFGGSGRAVQIAPTLPVTGSTMPVM